MPSKQRPSRQIMPGTRIQDPASETVDRQSLRQEQTPTFYADGNEYAINIIQSSDPDTNRIQININDSWAFGALDRNNVQVSGGSSLSGNGNRGNALFWRDLQFGLDRMYLDGDGQLRVQSATPLRNGVNDCFLMQATSDAGATQDGCGVGMVFQVAASNGAIPISGTINCIASTVDAATYAAYLAFSAYFSGALEELLQLGASQARWRASHMGALEAFKLGFGHVTLPDADYALSTFQEQFPNIQFIGVTSAARNVTVDLDRDAFYIIHNNTTGVSDIHFGASTGARVTVPQGKRCLIYCDGTDFVQLTALF